MAWPEPKYPKSAVKAAGKILAGRREPHAGMSLDTAMDIAGNWRSSHGYPLQSVYMTLKRRAEKADKRALVAQRKKRLRSIKAKLQREPTMPLSNMQDLGGCRAIVKSITIVKLLAESYRNDCPPTINVLWDRSKDYISAPRPSGYRGIHLICEYNSQDPKKAAYKGHKIEIQLRTKLQHAWATAVELIDVITKRDLKSGLGDDKWKRFFYLLGDIVADAESQGGHAFSAVSEEATALYRELHVRDRIRNAHQAIAAVETARGASSFVMALNSETGGLRVYGMRTQVAAADLYLRLEKQYLYDPSMLVVDAAAGTLKKLKAAYPNYYLDTEQLVALLDLLDNKLNPKERRELWS